MDNTTELYGVKIPERLWQDREQAILYAAGYIYAKTPTEEESNVPAEIRQVWETHQPPNRHSAFQDPNLGEYKTGFIVGGGATGGGQQLPQKQRISTRREDNKNFRRS